MVKNVLKKKCCLCSPAGMVIELVSVFVNLEVTLLIFHCALQLFFFSPNCVLFNSKFFIFFRETLEFVCKVLSLYKVYFSVCHRSGPKVGQHQLPTGANRTQNFNSISADYPENLSMYST